MSINTPKRIKFNIGNQGTEEKETLKTYIKKPILKPPKIAIGNIANSQKTLRGEFSPNKCRYTTFINGEKLPLLINKRGFNSFLRMKQYKVTQPRPRQKIIRNENSDKENEEEESEEENNGLKEKPFDYDKLSPRLKDLFGKANINIINNIKAKNEMNKNKSFSSFEEELLDGNMNNNNLKNINNIKKIISRKQSKKKLPMSVDRIGFDEYLKLQSKAEQRLRPKLGDESKDLIEYINKLSYLRSSVIDGVLEDIDKTENRYNSENPRTDMNFRTKNKVLEDNKWKNSFKLKEYQKFFSKYLKGRISSLNYRQMLKKFRQISLICFNEGALNLAAIRRMDFVE